jgi:hypothetical protein
MGMAFIVILFFDWVTIQGYLSIPLGIWKAFLDIARRIPRL